MSEKATKTAIVTGGSSGIGRCTAAALAKAGYRVYEFSRREVPLPGVVHRRVDVTDEQAVRDAVAEVAASSGGIDAVVNCAGFGISGAVEFTELSQAKAQFEVNFFGTVNVNRAVIPFMRRAGHGRIVNVSSVAAAAHIPFQTFYSASKAALSSYSCALDNEIRCYGIRVTAVELGDICTGFTKARQKNVQGDDVYGGRISRSVGQMEQDEQKGMAPEVVGTHIARLVQKKTCAPLVTVGVSYKVLGWLCRALPSSLRGWIVGKIYAD